MFFTQSRLIKGRNMPEIQQIANALSDIDMDAGREFLDAMREADAQRVNQLLEDALAGLTGQTNSVMGLSIYCEKFGLDPQAAYDDMELVKFIAANNDAIDAKLRQLHL